MKTIKKIGQLSVAMMAIILVLASCRKAPDGVTISASSTAISAAESTTITATVDGDFTWVQWYVTDPGASEAVMSAGGSSNYPLTLDSNYFNNFGTGQYKIFAKARNCRGNKDLTDDCKNTATSNEIVITVTP